MVGEGNLDTAGGDSGSRGRKNALPQQWIDTPQLRNSARKAPLRHMQHKQIALAPSARVYPILQGASRTGLWKYHGKRIMQVLIYSCKEGTEVID